MPELTHGKLVQLADNVHRITAPNPGIMTGAGTNTYLLGREEIAVVDPGPALDEHVEAILAGVDALGGRLARIFATHTHTDHSPATAGLLRAVDAEVIGRRPPDHMYQDDAFAPAIEPVDNEVFETAEYRLRAIHTPGHVGNHVCYLEERSWLLMTGDHIMNGSTVVIIPPSGDMAAYLESLKHLLDYPVFQLAPGHGDLMAEPHEAIRGIIDHRLGREAKVLEKLGELGEATIEELVTRVYDDVDRALHGMAKLSLEAHLIKLAGEHRAVLQDGQWTLSA